MCKSVEGPCRGGLVVVDADVLLFAPDLGLHPPWRFTMWAAMTADVSEFFATVRNDTVAVVSPVILGRKSVQRSGEAQGGEAAAERTASDVALALQRAEEAAPDAWSYGDDEEAATQLELADFDIGTDRSAGAATRRGATSPSAASGGAALPLPTRTSTSSLLSVERCGEAVGARGERLAALRRDLDVAIAEGAGDSEAAMVLRAAIAAALAEAERSDSAARVPDAERVASSGAAVPSAGEVAAAAKAAPPAPPLASSIDATLLVSTAAADLEEWSDDWE